MKTFKIEFTELPDGMALAMESHGMDVIEKLGLLALASHSLIVEKTKEQSIDKITQEMFEKQIRNAKRSKT